MGIRLRKDFPLTGYTEIRYDEEKEENCGRTSGVDAGPSETSRVAQQLGRQVAILPYFSAKTDYQ